MTSEPTFAKKLFLDWAEWERSVGVALVVSVPTAFLTIGISIWLAVTVFLVVLTVLHMARASRYIVPLPHIVILISSLQYVLAAWLNYYLPAIDGIYSITGSFSGYLQYAGPVLIALVLSWGLALVGLPARRPPSFVATPSLFRELDFLFWGGIAASASRGLVSIPSLSFALLLVGNLRYVGAFGRMIAKGEGWQWQVGILLIMEVFTATGTTMFHDLLLWTVWTYSLWIFCFAPPRRIIFATLAVAIIFLPALQQSKWELRDNPAADRPSDGETTVITAEEAPIEKSLNWVGYFGTSLLNTITLNLETDSLIDMTSRYNQGWIISRVMAFVPDFEPYARGETIKESVQAAILPRLLDEDKITAGGQQNMLRYAGIDLQGSTSMNLGYAGEMYANFGQVGGVIGSGIYMMCLALLFRWVCRRAFRCPLWWAFVPYVFYAVIKAEDDVAYALNWVVKASVLSAVVIFSFPSIKRTLFARPNDRTIQVKFLGAKESVTLP